MSGQNGSIKYKSVYRCFGEPSFHLGMCQPLALPVGGRTNDIMSNNGQEPLYGESIAN